MSINTVTVAAGSQILSPFSQSQDVFVIKLGYVLALTYQTDGKRRIHLIYGPGAYFPVLTTFRGGEQRATYETLTRVALTKYSRSEFLATINKKLNFSNQVLNKTVDQLSIFADRVIELQLTKTEDKLLHRLQILAKEHGRPHKKGLYLPYKLKHYHLADMLGIERESATRAMALLRKKNLIAKDSAGRLVILNNL